jgi:diaminopimelate decarboxylase
MKTLGINVFVNSPKHLLAAYRSGFLADQIIFTGTNLSDSDFEYVIAGNLMVNVDSIGQLDRYGRLNPAAKVGLRINPTSSLLSPGERNRAFVGLDSRIGILEMELPEAFAVARKHGLILNGVHVYLGTNLMDLDSFRRGAAEVLRIAEGFPDLEYVDFGGGFGVRSRFGDPPFDLDGYGAMIAEKMRCFSEGHKKKIKLIIEPGRALVADTGYFLTTVVDVKDRPSRIYIGVDASVDIFPRPLFYEDAYHEITVYGANGHAPLDKPADICGNTTYSRDFLGRDRFLPRVSVGDILVVHNAGGYCYSAITDFLGRLKPAEVLVNHGTAILIRPKETLPGHSRVPASLPARYLGRTGAPDDAPASY